MTEENLSIETCGDPSKPCLIYLPGIHADSTLFTSFRLLAREHFFLVEITYPRTLSWTLQDYARAVWEAISKLRILQGWVLAESYSSQVAWEWLKLAAGMAPQLPFHFQGIILAGGFVRYPFPWIVRVVGGFFDTAPWPLWKMLFAVYLGYSRFRHRNAPKGAASAHAFIDRRTKRDIAAMRHRLRLIHASDPSRVAAAAPCPIYLLAGFIDPIVPTWPVLRWLRKNCPSFRSHRIIWPADHNVLGTEPAQSLLQILEWIQPGQETL